MLDAILFMKQCMHIEVRPHMCGDARCGNVVIGGVCCIGFINFIVVAGVWRQRLAISIGPN
jgi:hypothetical protein